MTDLGDDLIRYFPEGYQDEFILIIIGYQFSVKIFVDNGTEKVLVYDKNEWFYDGPWVQRVFNLLNDKRNEENVRRQEEIQEIHKKARETRIKTNNILEACRENINIVNSVSELNVQSTGG